MTPRPAAPALLALHLGLGLALLAGCSVEPPSVSAEQARNLAKLDYPKDAKHGGDLPVVVTRDGSWLTFHHAGTADLREMRIWINREYAGQLPLVQVGSGTRFNLTRTVNRHGEAFPIPQSFLVGERERKVVLVELVDPETGVKYRLTTRPQPGVDD